MTETLTAEERNMLDDISPTFGGKALRVIDDLTRERDEARQLLRTEKRCNEIHVAEKHMAESAVGRLTSEIAQLGARLSNSDSRRVCAETEVARLTEALAAAREGLGSARVGIQKQAERAEAAEARVRELTECVSQALTGLRPGSPVREALEEALRAP